MANHIRIDWAPSSTPISGYNVYRGTAAGNESNIPLNNSPVTDDFYIDYTVFPGQIYSYAVTAVLNGVESAESLDIVSTQVPHAPSPTGLDLGAAAGFGLLAASTITNVPGSSTIVTGDIGLYPGTSVTGFEGIPVSGSYHLADYVAGYAQASVTSAFVAGMGLTGGVTMDSDIGGQELLPGIYKVATTLTITGPLVLDANSDPNAVWIFQIGTSLTTASGDSNVILVGGAQASNVYWLVGSSATIGTGTTFAGNIISYASITVNTGAFVNGRLAARNGAITLDGDKCITFGPGFISLPPSPPNTPPAPPAAPTNLTIEEVR
jgi:hypothetical protein